MDQGLLILIVLFGIALLIAIQGYGFIMHGRVLLDPEQRAKVGGRFIYTSLALVMVGTIVALMTAVLLFSTKR
jgi:hypothetical protein